MSSYINRVGVIAVGVIAPLAIAHGLSTLIRPVGVVGMVVVELMGYAFLMAMLRPRPLVALQTAVWYVPLMSIVSFYVGYSAGYDDWP